MQALDLPKTEVTIDGTKFQIGMLDAITGSRLAVKLQNALGAAIRNAQDSKGVELALVGGVLETVTPELMSELCTTFGRQCRVETEPGKMPVVADVFSQFFAGRYWLMYRWLWECLRLNFADFLSDKGLANALGAAGIKFPSMSPPT